MRTIALVASGLLPLVAMAWAAQQLPPYRVLNGQTDSDGFPTTAARLCIGPASSEQCYEPSPVPDLAPFGLNAMARGVKLVTGARLVLFTAEAYEGGSGSLTSIALLENRTGKLIDLLPTVRVTNQSEYRMWNLPTISELPILVTADYIWNINAGETHFAQHLYRITSYVYDKQAGHYVQRDEYVTKKKYAGLDDTDEIRVLEPEKPTILKRLQRR
ncbi:MAG: hypothetical protein WBS24_06100 [Terriglobales bacterium]